jgi:hypothetical protein
LTKWLINHTALSGKEGQWRLENAKTLSLDNSKKFKQFFTEYSDNEMGEDKVGVASMERVDHTILI